MSPLGDPSTMSGASFSQSLLGLRSSPPLKDLSGLQRNYQPSAPRTQPHTSSSSKKGAQPSADGFFHCRLCDKCFEKVKSLNAHMKSHAMKARAEAEAKAQVDAQLAAQNPGLSHSLLSPQDIGLPHPRPQHPLFPQVHSAIIH
ncbi:zinc finger, C2H2 type [Oesophagostomum dentatum]|uniref:Zinc finger, C2H2 type n=1 Tax=Oesophagostomum dentatum TaxID=61180 RepID=A0A0B1TP47_OESDE|nr:zinc finger, C2H2 type [Oesophagostomum dentatum]